MKSNSAMAMFVVLASLAGSPLLARAADDAADKAAQKKIAQAVYDEITVEAKPLTSDAVAKVLSAKVFRATITTKEGEGVTSSYERLYLVEGDKVSRLPDASGDRNLSDLTAIVNKNFKLTKATSKQFEAMLDELYPIRFGDDEKSASMKGSEFRFVRGKAFGKIEGFIVKTDAQGLVKSIAYSLEMD